MGRELPCRWASTGAKCTDTIVISLSAIDVLVGGYPRQRKTIAMAYIYHRQNNKSVDEQNMVRQ